MGRLGLAAVRRSRPSRISSSKFFIRLDNLLHQIVPHDVPLIESDERDAFNTPYHFQRLDQSGTPPSRQIDLRDITRDNCLGVEPQARQKHFHLLAGRILRLVQNNE